MRLPSACVVASMAAMLALASTAASASSAAEGGVLDHRMKRIDGSMQDLGDYRGQVLLLVNVASQCGLTPQYEGLEALYESRRERGFAVLGFPANDFANQEPGSDAEIAEFCRSKYGIRFPMFSKIVVKGPGQHPLYRHVTTLPEPLGGEVTWNFEKFLVDRSGRVVARFAPRTRPDDPELLARIETLLDEAPPDVDAP